MTPKEFEKMVKDYPENGLSEGSALICLHGGENNFGVICGKGLHVATTVAMNMFLNRDFAELVRLACDFYNSEGGPEMADAAETVSDYLDRMGFRKEE